MTGNDTPMAQRRLFRYLLLVLIGILIGSILSPLWGCENNYPELTTTTTTTTTQQKGVFTTGVVSPPTHKTDGNTLFVPPPQYIRDSNENSPWPRIAWLMSFPNSGTSYTIELSESATMTTMASNYGEHHPDEKGNSVPVHEYNPNGPSWIHSTATRPKDGQYVLTKTHCGGRCFMCGPNEYITTPHVFLKECTAGTRMQRNKKEKVMYDPSIVSRVVHLYRNPFDNVVSRYHLQMKKNARKKYKDGRKGFRLFCKEMLDDKFYKEALKSELIDDSLFDIIKSVPCHHDFIRYVQWHNFASLSVERLRLPTLVLHYEDYETKFNETLGSLLNFLGFEYGNVLGGGNNAPLEFVEGKSYMMDYFTSSEIEAVQRAMGELAFPDVWNEIKHYFMR